ncbi:MAG: hypothetical protein H6684_12720 [Deltaproteobacteria bacterium]|nr:hypothetical protein [bacterium]MCB9489587.1 hypothetical protein [Deltaproteobacteria bacterium]
MMNFLKKALSLGSLGLLFGALMATTAFAEYPEVSFSGYADVQAELYSYAPDTSNSDDELSSSDIYVFEAAFAPHVDLSKWVSMDAVFYYIEPSSRGDGGGSALAIDEWYVTVTSDVGIYVKGGLSYPPVGDFTTWGVGYTRVQDLIWTQQSELALGYDHDFVSIQVAAFNGGFDNTEDDGSFDTSSDQIDGFAASLAVMPLANMDDMDLTIGGYFLSDATETLAGLGGNLNLVDPNGLEEEEDVDGDDVVVYESDVPLYGGYLAGEFTFSDAFALGVAGEFATTGEFDEAEYTDAAGEATAISAYHAELVGMFDEKNVQVGVKFAGISGLDWLGSMAYDPTFEPTTFTQFGGYVGIDYIPGIHLALQHLAGSDDESTTENITTLQGKVSF